MTKREKKGYLSRVEVIIFCEYKTWSYTHFLTKKKIWFLKFLKFL